MGSYFEEHTLTLAAFGGSAQSLNLVCHPQSRCRPQDPVEVRRRTPRSADPTATRRAILQIVDASLPPLRILLGDGALQVVTTEYESRLGVLRFWEPVSIAAPGESRHETP
jgi:hypothetical protein